MKLMCDLDATIFPTYEALNILHKAIFGKEITWDALVNGKHKFWKTKEGIWVRRMFNHDLFFAELYAYKGVRETLRYFMSNPKNEILYCTARNPCLEEATAYSIGRNQLPYGDIIFVSREDVHINKLEIAVIEGCDIAIDDETRTLFALQDACITICYTQPYNLKYSFGIRADNWLEIGQYLTDIQKGGVKGES